MPIKTIVLCANYTNKLSYFDDWIDAFESHKNFDASHINIANIQENPHQPLLENLEQIDLIILHHSMTGDTLKYLKPFVSVLQNRKGKLISFIGNEVNLPHMGMAPKIEVLTKIEPDIIATQLLDEAGQWLYSDCENSKIVSLPHALNPKKFYPNTQYHHRLIDIGTRSARYGSCVGDNDRNHIIQYFQTHAKQHDLTVDLEIGSNNNRFNRDDWCAFLNTCRATLSTEAGSFYLEKDDALVKNIEEYFNRNAKKYILPQEDGRIRAFYRRVIPNTLRKFLIHFLKNKIIERDMLGDEVDPDIIIKNFFSSAQKCPVYSKAISSRHFDAIGTKTLNVMFQGRYNDILSPWEHYFPLERDYSNVDDLKMLLSDQKKIKKITNNTYEFVIKNHTHHHRLDKLLKMI